MTQLVTVNSNYERLIPPLSAEELAGLATSIIAEGCRDSLIVNNGVLLDGHNRYRICIEHNIPFKTKEIQLNGTSPEEWIILNQFNRRNISNYTRTELALELESIYAAKAKANQRAAGGAVPAISPKAVDTREEIAKKAGVSSNTVSKVKIIKSKADPETLEKLACGEISINQAHKAIKRAEKEAAREARREKNREKIEAAEDIGLYFAIGMMGGRFSTIVIDPPWDWGDENDHDQLGRARPDYATMSIEEIKELPVGELADTDCHLYMWITNRSLPKGFRLLEHWGFRYITAITWVKPSFGMGNYFRGQTEHVLFGVKGSQPLKRKDIGTVFHAPRGPAGHSSKPMEFYELVESCSPGPYLEMFSRHSRKHWESWGE